jgi:RimJ/RimL family protein N-acetyltransferase
MTASFPSPYTRDDAEWWIANVVVEQVAKHFAIEVGGALAGGIGIQPKRGEHAGCALFGYWLGVAFWGRGIATDAARTAIPFAFREMGLRRLEASVFEPNAASVRILENVGFRFEGRLREAYVERDGTVRDALLYARLATDPAP